MNGTAYFGPVVRLLSYSRGGDKHAYTLFLSCGHAVSVDPANQEDMDSLGPMLLAHDKGEVIFTHCQQCKHAGPVINGEIVRQS